eukprot:CFRG7073T1
MLSFAALKRQANIRRNSCSLLFTVYSAVLMFVLLALSWLYFTGSSFLDVLQIAEVEESDNENRDVTSKYDIETDINDSSKIINIRTMIPTASSVVHSVSPKVNPTVSVDKLPWNSTFKTIGVVSTTSAADGIVDSGTELSQSHSVDHQKDDVLSVSSNSTRHVQKPSYMATDTEINNTPLAPDVFAESDLKGLYSYDELEDRIPPAYPFRCNSTGGQRWIRKGNNNLERMVGLGEYSYTTSTQAVLSPKRINYWSVVETTFNIEVVISKLNCAHPRRNTFDVYVVGPTIYHEHVFKMPDVVTSLNGKRVCEWRVTLPSLYSGRHEVNVVLDYLGDRALAEPSEGSISQKDYIWVCSDPNLSGVVSVNSRSGTMEVSVSDELATYPHCALGLRVGKPRRYFVVPTPNTTPLTSSEHEDALASLPPSIQPHNENTNTPLTISNVTQANDVRLSTSIPRLCEKGENPGRWVHFSKLPGSWRNGVYDLVPNDNHVWVPFNCMYRRFSINEIKKWAEIARQPVKIAMIGDSTMEQIRFEVVSTLSEDSSPNKYLTADGKLWSKPGMPIDVMYYKFWGVYQFVYGKPCAPVCPRGHPGDPKHTVRKLKEFLKTKKPTVVLMSSVLHDLMQSTLTDYKNVKLVLKVLDNWVKENTTRRALWISGTALHNGIRFKPYRTTTRVRAANDMVLKYINDEGFDSIEYVDLYHLTVSRPDRSYDGVHYTLRKPKKQQISRYPKISIAKHYCAGNWFDQQTFSLLQYPASVITVQAAVVFDTLIRGGER